MSNKTEEELRHALGNAKAETEALKSMLSKAAERLEGVVEADCSQDEQEKALATARRLRVAIARTGASTEPKVVGSAEGQPDGRSDQPSAPC